MSLGQRGTLPTTMEENMAKIVYGLAEIYWEIDPLLADMKLVARLGNLGELCRLRDGKNTCDSSDTTPFGLPEAQEMEERDRSGGREYGFGSPKSLYRDRRDRRIARLRGHRCGKK